MKEMSEEKSKELDELIEAVKFNYNIRENNFILEAFVPEEELDLYRSRITHLTLPRRFGMYKTQTKNVKAKEESFEAEEPETTIDKDYMETNKDHRIRPIFPVDD